MPSNHKDSFLHRPWVIRVLFILALLIAGICYFIHRQYLRVESIENEHISYYVSGAINRAILMETDDFHNTKTDMRRELRFMFNFENPKTYERGYCKTTDNINLYAIMPYGKMAPAEYQNCYVSSHGRIYEKGITEFIYHNFIRYIPFVNLVVGLGLGDVYDTMIYIPNYMFINPARRVAVYDALKNPCKYLANSESYNKDEELKNRGGYASFDIDAWKKLKCGQNELQSFDLKIRIFENSPQNTEHFSEEKIHVTNKGGR